MAFATLFVLLIIISFLIRQSYKFYTTVRSIPSPPGLPILGNIFDVLSDPEQLYNKVHKLSSTYFPIFRLSFFYYTIVFLSDPSDVELVLSNTRHLSKSRVYRYLSNWLGNGLLTSTGMKWHNRRKILTPSFHFDVLQEFVPIFNDETKELVKMFEENCEKTSTNIVPIVTHFTLQSIGETAMGFKSANKEDQREYKKAVYQIGQIVINRIGTPWFHIEPIFKLSSLGRKEKAVIKTLHNFTKKIIAQREADARVPTHTNKNRMAMLDLLLKAKDRGEGIDFDGIREEVDTFMFEGHDTTAMAISFLLLTLSNLPEIQSKIVKEILQVVGPEAMPTYNDLQNLKYTECCIKECLRLFPSVPYIARRAGEDFKTTQGYLIPKKTIVFISIYEIHRNPNFYPDPLEFNPDRFLPEVSRGRHPFAYLPFSAGPRNCIGQKFALLELKAALCGILRKFVLEKVDDMFDVKIKPDLLLRPKNGIRIKIKRLL